MTDNDGTQGPQWPLPDDEDAAKGGPRDEQQEPPARPMGDRTVVFGAPQLGGQAPQQQPPAPRGRNGPPRPLRPRR
ncbi:hypothetical protein GEV43_18885 [Actinomadura sp. J1-007]|uniref:hypothetical protein n=1 Tax=Actinomadura sp. J1-007 TaxID=2661913 RepID=UPI0013282C8E|nr:hypothetical protein [Actinomadura sp. J1-007]MWK35904.1 hypothetical protein [Actinomadura sp. J1-007]